MVPELQSLFSNTGLASSTFGSHFVELDGLDCLMGLVFFSPHFFFNNIGLAGFNPQQVLNGWELAHFKHPVLV